MQYEKSPCILLFPEGTDLSESNIEKATAFAREKLAAGAPAAMYAPRQYVLFPKVTGSLEVIKHLIPPEPDELVIHDVTLAYRD